MPALSDSASQVSAAQSPLVVQKFGGSSMGTPEKIAKVAEKIALRRELGVSLVVVVSAMQGETDRLSQLASCIASLPCDKAKSHQASPGKQAPNAREMDQLLATGEQVSAALLAMRLRSLGVPARSMTAQQMSLRTDGSFSRARITRLDPKPVSAALAEGEVVVATGFQGVDHAGNITTLGRGGSDTSAVAIAAALGADECEIYTDVDGVFTADPRICPKAKKIDAISFEEMMEMASLGAKVLQIRSVELAMNHRLPLRVLSTFGDTVGKAGSKAGPKTDPQTDLQTSSKIRGTLMTGHGTRVEDESEALERLCVRGISHNCAEVKLTLREVPDQPGISAQIFAPLATAQVNVDVIVQNISAAGATDLSFTVGTEDRDKAEAVVHQVAKKVGARGVEIDDAIAKVSIVGVGMRSHFGVAARMFQCLADAQVNIQMITTSEIKVTCVIVESDAERAVQALHQGFELDGAGMDFGESKDF